MTKPKEPPLHSLFQISLSLAQQLELLRDDKKRENIPGDQFLENIKECIKRLEQWDTDKDQVLIAESKKMVWAKLADTIQKEFIKYDKKNESEYHKLLEYPPFNPLQQEPTKQQEDSSNINSDDDKFEDFEGKFDLLSDKEKKCLYWFSLFPKKTDIKRKELIWWWEGSDQLPKHEYDEILGKLYAKGFIKRDKSNKRIPVTYTLHEDIWLDVKVKASEASEWCDEYVCGRENIDVESLDLLISKWPNKNELKYLSLRGITGTAELSREIYDLVNLRFLDVRAWNNFEIIPEGIERLRQLVHLDLSECYLLDQLPKGIAMLYNLHVLKGFVIKQDPPKVQKINNNNNTKDFGDNTSCTFKDLSQLKLLRKLTIRTRRMNFPTSDDLHTLSTMIDLNSLGIKWVTSSTSNTNDHTISINEDEDDDDSGRFPPNLEKLDLQAMPKQVKNRVFGRIRETSISLRKLSIRGGDINDLGPMEYCFEGVEFVRLIYLEELSMTWNEFIHSFPNLTRLEMHRCPKLESMSFPCDNNGVFQRAP